MRSRLPALLALLLMLTTFTGCFYSREIAQTQRAIASDNPDVKFDRRFTFNVGPVWTARLAELAAFGRVDEARLASDYLRDVRRVEVGIFRMRGDVPASLNFTRAPHLQRRGWQALARVREPDGENVSVLYRERYGEIRDLFVIVLAAPDLVIVRLTGNLTNLVLNAWSDFSDRIPRFDVFDSLEGRGDDLP